MYDSIRKYFFGFILSNFCINTLIILHQSSTGIGNILNIAKFNDITALNINNISNIHLSTILSIFFTAATGPDNHSTHSLNSFLLNENIFHHI